MKPGFEEEDNLDEKATSDEEFDCSSVTVSSEGERKIAALDEKSRRLKAQFAEENRLAIESMDKIREEIKQSQEREDAITNDMEEMRQRQDEIKQDLRRLDEISKRREREEEKWKAKIDKKKKKIAERLEKVRADRFEYQQETEADNENPENQGPSAVELKNGAGRKVEQASKDATKTTTSCHEEDKADNILYEPHEVKEYSSVRQLEKKRKELRRLEKMEKKAIKREKLEQRERKKIEKEKRKVARKLEKLRTKNSAVTEKNLGYSESVDNQAQAVSSALLHEDSEEPQIVNQTEHQTIHLTATYDVDQKEQNASNEASDRDPTEGHSSSHSLDVRPSVSKVVTVALGNSELDISEGVKKPVFDRIICETEVAELSSEELETMQQRSFELPDDKYVATEGSVGEELEKKPYHEFVMENSKESSHSGDDQMDNEDASEDVEIDCLEKEDTLEDISVELFSIEEEVDRIEPHNNPKCGRELLKNFESEECASKTAGTEYNELTSFRGEILVNNSSKRKVVSTGTIGASGKEPLAKSDDFDQTDGECHDKDGLLQCLDDTGMELSTRSKKNKWSGYSLEKSVPRPEYIKEDGNDVPDELVNDGNDDFEHGNRSPIENCRRIANEPSTLMRKVSGRLTPGGLKPLFNSHGAEELNSIFEDTVPSEEEVEDKVRGEDGQFPLEESSSLNHLETASFEDETWNHDHEMNFKDLPKEMQEAIIQQYAACTDVEGAENVEVEIVYEEVSRRSSDANSFSIVCEEASVQTCDQESWLEQDIVEEIDDASIKEPSLSEERPLAILTCDEMNVKQESVHGLETKPEAELGESGGNVGRDHHELRDRIDKSGVMEFSEPPLTASEAVSAESSLVHSPDLQSSTAGRYNKGALPEELKPLPMKAASTSNSLEYMPISHAHKCSDRLSSHQKSYLSQSTAMRNFQEVEFIAEFDDGLDEIEEALKMAENQSEATTVYASKVVGAFPQSTVESPDRKTQEVFPHHGTTKSVEKFTGLKEDTTSHQDINIPLLISDGDTNNTPLAAYKEAIHYSHSHQSGNGEDVEKAFMDRNLHPIIDIPNELDSSAPFNCALQSDHSGDRDAYSSESRASSFGNNMLEKTNDQKLFLGSENKDVHNRGEVSDFAYRMEGPLAETKVQDEQRLLMDLDAINTRNQQLMEENAQNDEDSFNEEARYDSSKNLVEVSGIATETSRADSAVGKAGDESPVAEIEELLREEDSKVEKSHSICDTGDELDSWRSMDDMLPSDFHCVIGGEDNSFFGAPYLCDIVNKKPNHKKEEQDRETLELETNLVSALESTAASTEHHRDTGLLSPRKDENISVVGECVKSTSNEVRALEIEKDTKLDSVCDLALPRVNGVKKVVSSAHQGILVPSIDDEVLAVGEESVLQAAPGMGRSFQKDNKEADSDVKANADDRFVSVDSLIDERLGTSLKEEFCQVDTPSKEGSQRPHATKRLSSGKGRVTKFKVNEDEFIDDIDRLLDEVEEDIRIEESMSSPKSNYHSSESKKAVEEIEDQSIIDVGTVDESVTRVTDIGNEESLLSSCDEEVAAINGSTIDMLSEDEEEPDSWDALNELVDRRFQNRDSNFVLNDGENRVSDERRRANYERRIAAVVNISEHLVHQELLAAIKALECEVTEIDTMEDEVKQSVTKHHVQKDGLNSPKEDEIQGNVTDKVKGVTCSGEKATVRDAIEQLNKLHSMVTDIREQLSGRNASKGQRFALKTMLNSVPVLLNSIRTLDEYIGEMAEELKQATEKSNKGSVKSDEHAWTEMLEESRKENAKMLVEITVLQEEVEAFKKQNESLHYQLKATKAELKCLQSRHEYKQRELTNLKNDFERKEKKWDDAEESLENALKDKLELLDDVEYLEESLRFSRENNERLNNRVDELNETIKELKKRAKMDNKRHEYGHLREEVELLQGSLELSNQRETLSRCKVDDLEAEVSHFKHCEQTLKSNLKTVKSEKSRIIEQLEEQLSTAENENTRMMAELSRASDNENLLQNENMRVIKQLEEQLNKLINENSMLNAELSKVSEKDNQMTELKSETTMVIKRLEDQLVNLEMENHNLVTELHKVSEKDNEMIELKGETSKLIEQLEDQLATLKRENSMLTTELYKASEHNNETSELNDETPKFISNLEDQLATLRKENSLLTAELYKASEKDNHMSEVKRETSKVINKLEDQLGTLRRENFTPATELSEASKKDNQESELQSETSKVLKKLEDKLATLKKKNSTLATELNKASEQKCVTSKVIKQLEDHLDALLVENSKLATEVNKASKKDYQMKELRRETSKVINKLEDQLATLKMEKFTLATELSKASKKDNQMSELKRETSKVINKLEDQLATLKEENSTLATKLSKVSEKDKQLTELLNQVENLTTENKLQQHQALEAKKQFADGLKCAQEETSRLVEGSMRSRRTRRSKSSDIKMLRRRIRQNEQEIEFLGRFIQQRGLEFGRRPQYHIDQDPTDAPDKLPDVKGCLNHEKEQGNDNQDASQVQEMEKVIEGIRKSLRQTENDLQQTKDALMLKTERTEFLERRVEETETLLEETSKRLRQNQFNLEQTDATLRQQLKRSATLENQLQETENARNTAVTSTMNKDQELEEAFSRICQKDQRIDDLINELKQERFDKGCLKRTIEVTEYDALREKGLLERLREVENQLQRTEELKETTLASLMDKQQELAHLHRSVSNKDAQIDDLTLELKQQRLDKDFLKRTIAVTVCNAKREKGLLERSTQLEKKLQEMQEMREKTLASLQNNKEALEQANNKNDELTQRLNREIMDKECLRRAVEAAESDVKREKELLEKREAKLEIQLQEMEKLQERTQSSLHDKATELQQVYTRLRRKDETIDQLKQELKQERSEKRDLKKAMERQNYNVQRQKILLNDKEGEVKSLKEQLCDYEKKVEKLNVNLKQMRTELEAADDILAYRKDNVGNTGISSRIQYDHLQVFPTRQSRHTKENFREIGSLMVHVADRLSKLLQRQKEVDSSAALLKQKEVEAKRVVESLRGELNQRDDELEGLKSALLKSVTEAECTRGHLREAEHENIDLKKTLADESDQVKKLEILVKQLEGDLERAQNSSKDKDTALEETKESLQLKRSLLTSMEAKLCLKDNEIEELRVANKERGLELERVQISLREVKKELESSSSIITKQNEEFVHLRPSVNRKTWEADQMKFRVEPTQREVKLLSIQLECAKKDKESLSRELAAATVRLENEQVLANTQKKVLQEQMKSGLQDLKDKSKLIWDMKMKLRESTARISRLETEKLEQEKRFRDYKRKLVYAVKQLKQSLNMANENERLVHSGIGSVAREMSELRTENQTLCGRPEDGIADTSSGLVKVRLAFVVTFSLGIHI